MDIKKDSKHIPIPIGNRALKYPWHDLKVGDSFWVENGPTTLAATANVRYKPKRFVQRRMDGGVRVWRVK